MQFLLSFVLHSTYNSTSNNILQLIRLIFILLNCNQATDWVLLIICASGCDHFQVMMYFMINACRCFLIATFLWGVKCGSLFLKINVIHCTCITWHVASVSGLSILHCSLGFHSLDCRRDCPFGFLSLDCLFLIEPLVFSNVYLIEESLTRPLQIFIVILCEFCRIYQSTYVRNNFYENRIGL